MPKYNLASRLVHHLALNSNIRSELLFDIEKTLFSQSTESCKENHHIFVSGLARAGTTILMNALYQSREFASLTYRDMPFVLAPNIWSKLTQNSTKSMQKEMRAHGDEIMIDYDSPEAFEEVFWRVFAGNDYIYAKYLAPHEPDMHLLETFRDYVALVCLKYLKQRYLSKNNNNILRLSAITNAFPNAKVLIPFRDPLQQAFSLLKQHEKFTVRHRDDKFSKKYMSWLVHHEFGLDHRPFQFDNEGFCQSDLNSIDYWLRQWFNAYTYLLGQTKTQRNKIFLVSYEDLCHQDRAAWNTLAVIVDVKINTDFKFVLKEVTAPPPENDNLRKAASELYTELLAVSRRQIGSAKQ